MTSEYFRQTQQRLAQLVDETLYPYGAAWTEIANYVRTHPDKTHYTLDELENLIGKKSFSILTAAFRLSMPPYSLFEATVEYCEPEHSVIMLSIQEYQHCILSGGFRNIEDELIDVERMNRHAVIHLRVLNS